MTRERVAISAHHQSEFKVGMYITIVGRSGLFQAVSVAVNEIELERVGKWGVVVWFVQTRWRRFKALFARPKNV